MRSRTLQFLLLFTSMDFVAKAAIPQEDAVLTPINALFHAMTTRDAAAMEQAFLPGAMLVLLREGKPTQLTVPAFAELVAKPSKTRPAVRIEERIHDPIIHIDNDLAVVWAPFDFLTDGKVDHCGTDLFSLIRQDGKWLITSVSDTDHASCPAQ